MKEPFSAWKKWNERNTLAGINYPGVYALAISPDDISTEPFDWRPEIAYIGMTNSKGGLKSRLQQFDNTVKKEDGAGHGGGARVRNRYPDYHLLNSQLYVSAWISHIKLRFSRVAMVK
jgi:hypothetical protein